MYVFADLVAVFFNPAQEVMESDANKKVQPKLMRFFKRPADLKPEDLQRVNGADSVQQVEKGGAPN